MRNEAKSGWGDRNEAIGTDLDEHAIRGRRGTERRSLTAASLAVCFGLRGSITLKCSVETSGELREVEKADGCELER